MCCLVMVAVLTDTDSCWGKNRVIASGNSYLHSVAEETELVVLLIFGNVTSAVHINIIQQHTGI